MLLGIAFVCNIFSAVFLSLTGSITALFVVLIVYIILESVITVFDCELSTVTWIFHILCTSVFFAGIFYQYSWGVNGVIDERNLDGQIRLLVHEYTKFWIIPAIKTLSLIISAIMAHIRARKN